MWGGVLRPATAKEMIYNADLQFSMRRGERLTGVGLRVGVIRGINWRDFLLASSLAKFQLGATYLELLCENSTTGFGILEGEKCRVSFVN